MYRPDEDANGKPLLSARFVDRRPPSTTSHQLRQLPPTPPRSRITETELLPVTRAAASEQFAISGDVVDDVTRNRKLPPKSAAVAQQQPHASTRHPPTRPLRRRRRAGQRHRRWRHQIHRATRRFPSARGFRRRRLVAVVFDAAVCRCRRRHFCRRLAVAGRYRVSTEGDERRGRQQTASSPAGRRRMQLLPLTATMHRRLAVEPRRGRL